MGESRKNAFGFSKSRTSALIRPTQRCCATHDECVLSLFSGRTGGSAPIRWRKNEDVQPSRRQAKDERGPPCLRGDAQTSRVRIRSGPIVPRASCSWIRDRMRGSMPATSIFRWAGDGTPSFDASQSTDAVSTGTQSPLAPAHMGGASNTASWLPDHTGRVSNY